MNFKKTMPVFLFIGMIMMMAIVATIALQMFEDEEEPEPIRNEFIAEQIRTALEHGQSEIVVLYGEASPSASGITYYFQNLSHEEVTFGLNWILAEYVHGQWLPMPFLPDAILDIAAIAIIIDAGQIQRETISFLNWHGELPAGRYMFIRRHHSYQGEYLLIEFTISP